jgi:hypothetical protein
VEILLAINENKCPMVVPDVPAREDEKFLYAYIKKTKGYITLQKKYF